MNKFEKEEFVDLVAKYLDVCISFDEAEEFALGTQKIASGISEFIERKLAGHSEERSSEESM